MNQAAFVQTLQTYLEQQAQEPERVPAGNKHVFEACMEHLDDELDFEEKMILMDYHMCYTQALDGARDNNLDASQHWLDQAEALPTFDKPVLNRMVAVNKTPAIAYHLYRESQFEKAIQLLEETIAISGTIATQDGIGYLVWGQMEDYINIFRVHCTAKDRPKALRYAQSILLAAVHGKMTPGVVDHVSPALLQQGSIDFISYATTDTLARLLKLEPTTPKTLLKEVLSPLWMENDWSNCPLEGYQQAVNTLQHWVEGDTAAMMDAYVKQLPTMRHQSPVLQFFLLEATVPMCKAALTEPAFQALRTQLLEYLQQIGVERYLLQHHSQLLARAASLTQHHPNYENTHHHASR